MESKGLNIIAIGGSAGAYEIIVEILENLPEYFNAAIIVVLHRNSKFETKIETSLSKRLNREVISIKDKFPILENNIYFAPPGYHTLVEPSNIFSLDISEPVQFSRPSIDVFFESLAEVNGKNTVAILLSGANNDGTNGFKTLLEHGATCYVQDPEEATIDTMPKSALAVSDKIQKLSNKQLIEYFNLISASS